MLECNYAMVKIQLQHKIDIIVIKIVPFLPWLFVNIVYAHWSRSDSIHKCYYKMLTMRVRVREKKTSLIDIRHCNCGISTDICIILRLNEEKKCKLAYLSLTVFFSLCLRIVKRLSITQGLCLSASYGASITVTASFVSYVFYSASQLQCLSSVKTTSLSYSPCKLTASNSIGNSIKENIRCTKLSTQ